MSDKNERGFAAMDDEQQREIASKGGNAAHEHGTVHEFNSEEARQAGQQSNKNDDQGGGRGQNTRGCSSEQHAEAGRQSHKNDR